MTATVTTRPRALAFLDSDAPRLVAATAFTIIVVSSMTATDLFKRLPLKLMSIGAPILMVGALFFTPAKRLVRTRYSLCMLAYLLLGAVSFFWSADPAATNQFFLYRALAAYLLMMALVGSQPLSVVLGWIRVGAEWLIGITVLVTIGIGRSRIGAISTELGDVAQPGWRGTFATKNAMSFYMIMALCAVLALEGNKPRRRMLGALATILIIGSRSSTGLGSLSIIPLYYIARYALLAPSRRDRAIRVATSTFAAFSVGVAGVFAAVPILTALGKDPTLSGRTQIWANTWNFTKQRPWFGWGISGVFTHPTVEPTYTIQRRIGFLAAHAHNGLLMVMTELGIVGVVLMVACVAIIGRRGFNDLVNGNFEDGFLLAGMTFILAISALSESVLSGFNLFVIPLLITIALHQDRVEAPPVVRSHR